MKHQSLDGNMSFNWYSDSPSDFHRQMDYVQNIREEEVHKDLRYDPPRPDGVGGRVGRYLSQHLLLAVLADAQEEGGMVMCVSEEGYWRRLYKDWAPEHHMQIFCAGLMQLSTLSAAASAATISQISEDLVRMMNTRGKTVNVPDWVRTVINVGR